MVPVIQSQGKSQLSLDSCISYFSVAVTKHCDQERVQKSLLLAQGPRESESMMAWRQVADMTAGTKTGSSHLEL